MSALTRTSATTVRKVLFRPSLLNPTIQRLALTLRTSTPSSTPSLHSSFTSSPPRSRKAIHNRTALITGSSRGIGHAIALRLARDGFDICIHDIASNESQCRTAVEEIQKVQSSLGREPRACYALGDVSKRDQVENIIATSVRELGDLDVMVANAGIAQVLPALQVSEADLQRMFEINVFGLVNCYIASAKQMIAQQERDAQTPSDASTRRIKGKIIGAASIASFKPTPLLSHYSASKFAVRGLTQAYAMELAEHNITVNAYAPGIVGTQMWDLIDSEMAKRKGMKRGEVMEKMVKENTALGRVSVAEDVSGLVSFLASEDSDFVTGQTQIVDGGIFYS